MASKIGRVNAEERVVVFKNVSFHSIRPKQQIRNDTAVLRLQVKKLLRRLTGNVNDNDPRQALDIVTPTERSGDA